MKRASARIPPRVATVIVKVATGAEVSADMSSITTLDQELYILHRPRRAVMMHAQTKMIIFVFESCRCTDLYRGKINEKSTSSTYKW